MSICIAVKKDNTPCTYKAKYGSYCGIHNKSASLIVKKPTQRRITNLMIFERMERIEAKLDLLLQEKGINPSEAMRIVEKLQKDTYDDSDIESDEEEEKVELINDETNGEDKVEETNEEEEEVQETNGEDEVEETDEEEEEVQETKEEEKVEQTKEVKEVQEIKEEEKVEQTKEVEEVQENKAKSV